MNDQQLDIMKKQLEEMYEHLIEKNEDETFKQVTEITNYDVNHPGDHATDNVMKTMEFTELQQREREVEKIERALDAIKNGTYGECQICFKEIPFERLNIVPYTLFCIEHAKEEGVQQ